MAGTSRALMAGTYRVKFSGDFPRLIHVLLDRYGERAGIDLMCNASGRNGKNLALALSMLSPTSSSAHLQMPSDDQLGIIRKIILEKRVEQFIIYHDILSAPERLLDSVDSNDPGAQILKNSWYIEYILERKNTWTAVAKDIDKCVILLLPLLRPFALLLQSEYPEQGAKLFTRRTLEVPHTELRQPHVLNSTLTVLKNLVEPDNFVGPDRIKSLSSGLDNMNAYDLYERIKRDQETTLHEIPTISRPLIEFQLWDPANRDDNRDDSMPNL